MFVKWLFKCATLLWISRDCGHRFVITRMVHTGIELIKVKQNIANLLSLV